MRHMGKKSIILLLLASIFSLSKAEELSSGTFQAILHKVEVCSDLLQPDDTLEVICWFQNIGREPAIKPLEGFAELSFGHQRILEFTPKYHRFYWDIFPATNQWETGDLWKTAFKCKMDLGWGGSYTIRIGLCDEQHLPVPVIGLNGELQEQVEIGIVDLGWGWGTPTMDQVRKPWSKVINPLVEPFKKEIEHNTSIDIGSAILVNMNKSYPIINKVAHVENDLITRKLFTSVKIRDFLNDRLIYSADPALETKYFLNEYKENSITYKANIFLEKKRIASYSLRFEVLGHQLSISFIDIDEISGYELLEVDIPSLLSLAGNDVELVHFMAGGRLLSLSQAIPEGYSFKYDTRNAAALLRADDKLVLESSCVDDRLNISVMDNGENKTANIGIVFVNRVKGNGKIKSILVEHNHLVTIDLLDTCWGQDGWQAVARFLRKDLKGVNRDLYRRALVYKQLSTSGPEPPAGYVKEDSPYSVKRLTTIIPFKDVFEIVKRNYHILDGMPQILYIGGFQKGGFDNSYPYVFDTDQRLGTVDELHGYIQEAKKYNTILSLHDNYDSDVVNSKYYDPRIVCVDENGKPWMGWFWAGGVDHIVSPYKYGKLGLMQERVKKTVNTYGITDSYHLDVLTSELLRYDYDPSCPASASKSLQGKIDIIKEFNKYGIDITSETLLHPFVGYIGFGLHARTDLSATFFHGECFIPLVDMVYHGTIAYEGGGRNEQAMLMGLMKGSSIFVSEEYITDDDIKWIYLHQMPVGLLYDKKIEKIEENKGETSVFYDDNTIVKVNFRDKAYSVRVDGQIVAKDWTTFIPGFKGDAYLGYSLKGGEMVYDRPLAWEGKTKCKAVILTFEGEGEELPCRIEAGKIIISMPKATPVRITMDD